MGKGLSGYPLNNWVYEKILTQKYFRLLNLILIEIWYNKNKTSMENTKSWQKELSYKNKKSIWNKMNIW